MPRKKATPHVNEETAPSEAIQERHTTALSARDWEMFTELMDNPPPPNEALARAARSHREMVVPRTDR